MKTIHNRSGWRHQGFPSVFVRGITGLFLLGAWAGVAAGPAGSEAKLLSSSAGDWPQWRGPNRDGLSAETGLLKRWPTGGPPLRWTAKELGRGHGAPSVAGGRVFGLGYWESGVYPQTTKEVAWALDQDTGKFLWQTTIGTTSGSGIFGPGSCSTPAADSDRVYVLGEDGDLACLDTATGRLVWHRSLIRDFGGRKPGYGYCDSPLVDEDRVVVTPFSALGNCMALSKYDGSTLWYGNAASCSSDIYSSVTMATVAGKKIYLQNHTRKLLAFDPDNGQVVWSYPQDVSRVIPTPICQSNLVFSTGGGAWRVHRLTAGETGITAEQVITNTAAASGFGNLVVVDGFVYGQHGGTVGCSSLATGKLAWRGSEAFSGAVSYADGHLYCRDSSSTIFLVEANPAKFVPCGQFETPDASSATYALPVLANRRLLLRDQDRLFCYDVADPTLSEVAFRECARLDSQGGVQLVLGTRDGAPLTAERVQKLEILTSPSLTAELSRWTPLTGSGLLTNGVWQVDDSAAPGTAQRFYRLRETLK